MVSTRFVTLAIFAGAAAGCGIIAGLPSDYELGDASIANGDDAAMRADAITTTDGSIVTDGGVANDGANPDVSAPPDASPDTATTPDASPDTGLTVPPSDPGNVACGTTKCPLPGKVCCIDQTSTCKDRLNPQCGGGVIASCDEAANCGFGQVCCLTTQGGNVGAQCAQACSGGAWQLCRTNAECGAGNTCVAWNCSGRTVATCNGVGADAGCH